MALVLSILFFIIFLSIYHADKKIIISPLFCLFGPYGLIMLLVAIMDMNKAEGLYKMSPFVPALSILILIISFLSMKFAKMIFAPNSNVQCANSRTNKEVVFFNGKLSFFVIILLFLLVLLYFNKFRFSIPGSVDIKEFFSSGLPGHLKILICVLFLFVYSNKTKNKVDVFVKIIGIFWLILLALTAAKYTMFFYMLSVLFIYFFRYRRRFTLFKILVIVVFISVAFIATYTFRFILQGYGLFDIPFDFIFDHYIYYLTGGYYGFSYIIENQIGATENVGVGLVYSGIINIFRLFSGQSYISSISRVVEIPISQSYSDTNVYTFFGSIVLEMGYVHLFLIVIAISFISTVIFIRSQNMKNRTNSNLLLPINCYILSTLFFSFYNCFLGPIFEDLLLIILFTVLANIWGKKEIYLRYVKNEEDLLHV